MYIVYPKAFSNIFTPDCMDLQAAGPREYCSHPLSPSSLARSYPRYCGTPAAEENEAKIF